MIVNECITGKAYEQKLGGDLSTDKILDEEYQKEYSEDILSYLRSNYDYQISDEAIIETIEANDYDFTTDGKIY